jgi:hypothetical protein
MAIDDYPRDATAFGKAFSGEGAFLRYSINVHWLEGFVWPVRGSGAYWLLKNGLTERRSYGK